MEILNKIDIFGQSLSPFTLPKKQSKCSKKKDRRVPKTQKLQTIYGSFCTILLVLALAYILMPKFNLYKDS